MIARLPLVLCLTIATAHSASLHAAGSTHVTAGLEAVWTPLDDPNAEVLPEPLPELPNTARAVFVSMPRERYLVARDLPVDETAESLFDAFIADEELMSKYGEFIPLEDDQVDVHGHEAVLVGCSWTNDGTAASIAAAYMQLDSGVVRALWIIAGADVTFEDLREELIEEAGRRIESFHAPAGPAYAGIIMGHDVSFALHIEREGSDPIQLVSSETPREVDTKFYKAITDVNPQFSSGIMRQWTDADAGASLSYEIHTTQTGLGQKAPFLYWLAGQVQSFQRDDPDDGDAPVEILHHPTTLTRVISDTELARHYANNKRAPEAGVILEVFLPKSPFARFCQVRWTEGEAGSEEYAVAQLIELRDYRRSRSETVLRACVITLTARAKTAEDRDALAEQLAIATLPRDVTGGFLATP